MTEYLKPSQGIRPGDAYEFRPENFMILPASACQAGCSYCFAKKSGQIMSRETACRTLDFIGRTAPAKKKIHITFHGGEPLLAGYEFYAWILPEIVRRFGRRAHLHIQSNLWDMTDAFAELFRKYRVRVGTSLDGPKDMCDEQRGNGYYDRTKAGMELLRRHHLNAGIICTFTAANAGRAGEVFRGSGQPYAIHGAVPSKDLTAEENAAARISGSVSVSPAQMERIFLDSYEAYKADPARSRITTLDAAARGCFEQKGCSCTFFACPGKFAAIAPDGGIYSCERFCGMEEYCLGNVSGTPDRKGISEQDILESPAWRNLRMAEEKKKTACGGCPHWDYCTGGCLYNAVTGGEGKDPYCTAYRALFDRMNSDMALEMGALMLGQNKETPVLAMAGDRPHPFDIRRRAEMLKLALEKGKTDEPFAEKALRNPYPENDLNKLYLHLTFDCPMRCAHCYAQGGERKTGELTARQFAGIVQEAADRMFRSVVITGGEPLAYREFDALCAMLSDLDLKGTKLILRSSFGFEIPPERMRSVCGLFDEIVVSVDGDPETHEKRRGAGSYGRSVSNLEKAVRLGAAEKLGIAAVLDREETEGEPGKSVRALAERLGIRKCVFRPLLPIGRGKGAGQEAGWQFCPEEITEAEGFRLRHTCGLGQNLYAEPDGTVYPCYAWCAPGKKLGDLSKESLGDILERGDLYEYCRHDVDTNEKCRTCEVRYLCGGICKAWVNDRENVDSGDFDCKGRFSVARINGDREPSPKEENHGTL